jgi:hypothetical protein
VFSFSIAQASAGVLVAFVCYLVLTGRLVSRRVVKDLREDHRAALERARAEAATWREAYGASEAARRVEAAHVGELLEGVRTTSRVLTQLPAAVRDGDSGVAA